jgi:hypothetical protein
MAVCFVIGIHFLVIQANRHPHTQLSTPMILGLADCFLSCRCCRLGGKHDSPFQHAYRRAGDSHLKVRSFRS